MKSDRSPGQAAGTMRRQAAGMRRRPRGWQLAAGVVVLVLAGAGASLVSGAFGKNSRSPAGTAGSGYATSTFMVRRESLTSQSQQNATLGDAGTYTVVVPQSSQAPSASSSSGSSASSTGSGVFTWLPQIGQTIRQGHRIYAVSGSPVVLLYGGVPAYRDLYEGLTGTDVAELNRDLVKAGYVSAAAMGPRSGWDYYSAQTAYGVEQLQTRLGLAVTGELSLGDAVFQPGPVLVTGLGTTISLGAPASPGMVVATATSTTPVVTVPLDAGSEGQVKAGDAVSVTLPSGRTTPGTITQVSTVAAASSSPGSGGQDSSSGASGSSPANGSSGTSAATINVLVSLDHPQAAANLNQAPVTVTITEGSVPDVLVVPVDALLAQPAGGYAVEITSGHGHQLVKVTPGLFDDAAGLVQVSGNLAPGQRVVVPGS